MTQAFTVPAATIACAGISLVLCVLVPVTLAILCATRRRGTMRAVLMGAACFVISVVLLESLFHQLVLGLLFPALPQIPAAYVLYGALTAGVFEETARLLGMRVLHRTRPQALTGFAYGVGHGGAEAILIGGLGMLNNLATMLTVNGGGLEELLGVMEGEELAMAQAQLEQLATMPPTVFLAGGVERISAIALHIALSMLVWMTVTGRLPRWGYPLAIALHAGVDVFAALYQAGVLPGIWLFEILIALATAAVCGLVWRLWRAGGAAAPVDKGRPGSVS